MNLPLPQLSSFLKSRIRLFKKTTLQHFFFWKTPLLIFPLTFMIQDAVSQGTWTPVATNCPVANGGVMLLLSDGTVMVKTFSGGSDGYGKTWYKLTPDATGSYIHGTWTQLAAMSKTRLYFSSQVLMDGRVYVAGGEYGTGGSLGEVYDPLTDSWSNTPAPGATVSDANSEILPDGRVLQALVTGNLRTTLIYNPATNTYSAGPTALGIHNESAWVKLADNSILFVDRLSTNSERYIPELNTWVADATVPVSLYDPYGDETGAALLLPDGRAFFLGSTGHTAYYTPSGSASPGSWTAGPDIPGGKGTPDAAAAMMVNGKILCAVSPAPTSGNHFPSPTSYYEFNYKKNSFKKISAPGGGNTADVPCYITNMLDLPDGTILFSFQDSARYYVYSPNGRPLNAGKPKIKKVIDNGGGSSYTLTGTLFNGISEGAGYGDDWQMATNYPIVRLTSGTNVYYARTYNWNSTGVMRGKLRDTTQFTLPAGLPPGAYSLVVTANGISSDPVTFNNGPVAAPGIIALQDRKDLINNLIVDETNKIKIYPNPARTQTTIQFNLQKASDVSLKIFDMNGKEIQAVSNGRLQQGIHSLLLKTNSFPAGVYFVRIITDHKIETAKLVVQ